MFDIFRLAINLHQRISNADIYSIVSRHKRHVRVAFREESDGLCKGKAEKSKGQTAPWAVWRTPWRSHANGKVRVINRNAENMGRTA